jgi:hypothetical protein
MSVSTLIPASKRREVGVYQSSDSDEEGASPDRSLPAIHENDSETSLSTFLTNQDIPYDQFDSDIEELETLDSFDTYTSPTADAISFYLSEDDPEPYTSAQILHEDDLTLMLQDSSDVETLSTLGE